MLEVDWEVLGVAVGEAVLPPLGVCDPLRVPVELEVPVVVVDADCVPERDPLGDGEFERELLCEGERVSACERDPDMLGVRR